MHCINMDKIKLAAALLKFFATQECEELSDLVGYCNANFDPASLDYKEQMQDLQHRFEFVAQDIIKEIS